ncbi:helix-turn-helix transcriptional regulator [Enterococcus faecalis]|uniref:helix-turn-helix domain-containing protein n=1 Tax=Enterococcus faecalis TaxID=1351 RepID=UPI0012E0DA95|nr:helix-turn-helix transcriptional regulator [Enterococcus faecalis]EGO5016470.1 helix-turn-helix transcriptional regulator [Enterococcus faecalis]EGO6561341.1 helix-turn-helix transcriptional regulator [Enterococcus faecalis]EGO7560942.1 helix-turn-helix transcriptional regulator [Enterococcus faecalis]EGO7742714.1 helix-turn-helix transcriptional regulator [Enterococcus faecalis]EGO8387399.1 XRE family transcriptional regulator [Enterococcus faecalis]
MELGKEIKRQREQLQMTQQELANQLHVSRPTISNWETERTYPDLQSLTELGRVFNVSIDSLLLGDKELVKKMDSDMKKGRRFKKLAVLFCLPLLVLAILFVWVSFSNDNQEVVSVDKVDNIHLSTPTPTLTDQTLITGKTSVSNFEGIASSQKIVVGNTLYIFLYTRPSLIGRKNFEISLQNIEQLATIEQVILVSGGVLNGREGISNKDFAALPSQQIIWQKK